MVRQCAYLCRDGPADEEMWQDHGGVEGHVQAGVGGEQRRGEEGHGGADVPPRRVVQLLDAAVGQVARLLLVGAVCLEGLGDGLGEAAGAVQGALQDGHAPVVGWTLLVHPRQQTEDRRHE